MSEAFVYLWYDAGWKRTGGPRYYIGKHKGTLDSGYVCSSKYMKPEWEKRGCKKVGCRHLFGEEGHHGDFHRRVLAYGTSQEMIDFEIKLLETRKDYFGNRYYNRVVVWVPCNSGEEHPFYKHGLSHTPEYKREWIRQSRKNEGYREKEKLQKKQYREQNREKVLLGWKQYYQQNKEKVLLYQKRYREQNKEKISLRKKQYREQNKKKIALYHKQWRERKKLEILESIASER